VSRSYSLDYSDFLEEHGKSLRSWPVQK